MDLNKYPRESRDWKREDLIIDERFEQCKKECCFVHIMFAINAAFLIWDMFVLGSGEPTKWIFVMGLPLHFFLLVVEQIVWVCCIWFVVTYIFKDMEVDPIGKIIPREKRNHGKRENRKEDISWNL